MNNIQPREHRPATFEETYPRSEFSELVRLAILIGAWLDGLRRTPRLGAWRAQAALRRQKRPTAPAS